MGEVEKEAVAVTGLISGAKILVPFVLTIVSIVGVYYAMDNRLSAVEKELSRVSAKSEAHGEVIQQHSITLSEVTTDIKHIKNDTKETLDLVRTLYLR